MIAFWTVLAAAEDKERVAVETTNMFAFGGVGIVGSLSPAEVAYHKIFRRPDSAAVFSAILRNSSVTREGKLFALIGLRLRDPAAYRRVLPEFLRSEESVSTASGCIVFSRPVGQIVREVDNGLWDDRGEK